MQCSLALRHRVSALDDTLGPAGRSTNYIQWRLRYSSNIGTAKVADLVGTDGHKEFLTRLGLLSKMQTELPEVAMLDL